MPRARYDAERGRLQADIERCEVELASVTFEPVATLTAIQEAWPEATDEERARMAQLILEEVHIDIDAKAVLYVKPRAAMLPLFELVRDEKVWPGDPERPRGTTAALSPALMSGVEERVVFTPGELAA